MDASINSFPPGDLRASDADRDRVLEELGEAFQAGRITAREFDERSGKALSARTGNELTALLADLPHGEPAATGGAVLHGAGPGTVCPGAGGRVPARQAAVAAVAVAGFVAALVVIAVGGRGHAGLVSGVAPVLVIALIALRLFRRGRR